VPLQQTAGKLKIEVDGTEVPEDVDSLLHDAVIEDNRNEPDLFRLAFRDPDRVVLTKSAIKIGSVVTISATSDASTEAAKLLKGEVTALELEHDSTGSYIVAKGYDRSHRLFRGRRTETYQDVTYSDVVNKVVSRAGLEAGNIAATSPVHPWVSQHNQSDWQFLNDMARSVGYEVAVKDGKLDFAEPSKSSDGPGSADLRAPEQSVELAIGAHILRLHAHVSASDQVPNVEVRGWDPTAKKALVSTADAHTSSASLSIKPSDLASTFSSAKLVHSGTYATQAETDQAAKALANHVGGSFVELNGVARGNPLLRAGTPISISLAGDPFDGKYVLTSTRHHYSHRDGYTTEFVVSGRNQRSLLGLTAGAVGGTKPSTNISGVVTGIVTDVNDPDKLARVKVKFPWLADSFATHWLRTLQLSAGPDRGAIFLPEVDDEVIVAFEHGDPRRGYVLGGVHNGSDKPKLGDDLVGGDGAVKRRGVVSKHGHMLVFFDDDSKDGVAMMTGDKNLKISLNKGTTTVKITSSGEVKIEGSKNVSVKAGQDMTVEAGSKLTLKGAQVEMTASGDITMSGTPIKLN
jgi:uncharacterized protein involved in type VI secretion and phage assembly